MSGLLRLAGATSGFVELAAPAVAGSTTLELPTDSIKPGLVLIATSSFSAASSVSVNNCFSSTYDNYFVTIDAAVASAVGIYGRLRMRTAGVDAAAASSYVTQETSFYGTTLAAARSSEDNSRFLNFDDDYETSAQITFFGPARPQPTKVLSSAFYGYLSASASQAWVVHTPAVSYDGFTFYPSSSTITGSLSVYGYRKVV